MAFTLVRVDDRVIHGQTTTRWANARNVFGILVVGDKIAGDNLRKRVLKAAAGNLRLGIYTEEQALETVPKAFVGDKDYFLISDSPQSFANLVKQGVDIGKEVNVGPMNTRAGTKTLGRTVSIDEKDYEAFDYLESQGIKVSFQLLPDDELRSWETMKKRYDSTTEINR